MFETIQIAAQYSFETIQPYATRDKEFVLTCNIGTNSGNAFIWTRNNVGVVTVRISDCFTADIGQGLSSSYKYNCTTSNKRYNLIIPATRINSEGGYRWRCEDSGGGGSSSTYTLQFYSESLINSSFIIWAQGLYIVHN
ncbi:hypothetical protein KUTeg_006088 [Tegillarca granosa]|uniref:Ig-like domain-containing protein n=1 Tax=Tegillarca granosa TaxID=220873 RepID=A0ABQ9FFH4_TEGGR|nr:hypothetical protein KUTeg_006088 [Tegillarca granosa]